MKWASILFASALALASLAIAVPAAAQDAAAGHEQKRIALSFDDAPRFTGALYSQDERTVRLIAALDRADAGQAVFFVNPGNFAKFPGGEERIAAYIAAGHVIANHTFSHPRLSETSAQDYTADIDAAADWLAGRKGHRPWFRFPYLDEGGRDKEKRDAIRAALAQRGLRNGYVTVDASDWFYDGAFFDAVRSGQNVDLDALKQLFVESHVEAAAAYDAIAQAALGRSPAHVLLLHESDLTVLALPDLIAGLRDDGWTIITADEAYADPIGDRAPDVPVSQGTIVEMIAWESGLPPPRWYERNNIGLARELFRTRVLGLAAQEE